LRVKDYDSLLKWKRRLTDLGIKVDGPFDRHYFASIYFKDPDDVILEIATDGPGYTRDEPAETLGTQSREPPAEMTLASRHEARINSTRWREPVPEIMPDIALAQGMDHISAISANIERTSQFLRGILGLRLVKRTSNFDDPSSAHWYW